MRPPLRIWVWTAATAALLLAGTLLWQTSDVAAVDSTTSAPADVPDAGPSGELDTAWSTSGAHVPRRVVERGRVLLGSARGITARDGVTGEEAWHYVRGNARLCDLTAVDGVVVAVFRGADRCDEAIALDAETGERVWTRNVDLRPDAELASTDSIVLAESPTGVVTLDPTGNTLRWRYQPPEGCRLLDADVGSTGVAVLQRCPGAPEPQLRLLNGFDGSPIWTRDVPADPGAPVRLAGNDRVVDLVVGDSLLVHAGVDGTLLRTVPLPAAGADPATEALQQAGIADLALVWARGRLFVLEEATGAVRWQGPARGLPSVREVAEAVPGAATVLVPEEGGFVRRDVATGEEVERLAVDDLPDGGRTSVVGPVVVYRLTDRVLGYR
ncbi:PQQ-binding-like beta-propeller repeat protein [Geodermatophilus sp. YIM 151500]|uniref:outer membrane protein assembly factor BamB family protein n=1 Tax=Geodermatophilus sp. YIM 151500 TaxID=2984531 RepID=UPI0021E46D58|nr:PQQ-binding-like beta-propeller repeat protein [Geodermatophilus sp. YIM 151500]MCV2488641.1 PQQ-binding-like beta-propeller repeat protein [Geodermatophilus sp. YIM 151500]